MKKGLKKLKPNRETVRNLSGNDAHQAAGAGWGQCGTLDCTNSCPATNCGQSGCFCPYTLSVAPAVPC